MGKKTQNYWESNIENWGKLYLESSHYEEQFDRPAFIQFFYHKLISPTESKLMVERYNRALEFIRKYVKSGMTVVDAGCGTGILSIEMLKQGAQVIAVDFSQKALDTTRTAIEHVLPEKTNSVKYILLDLEKDKLPASDIVIAMGVTPYIQDIDAYFNNILPTTSMFYCLYIDPEHWINRIRKIVHFINVRDLHFYNKSIVDKQYEKYNWKLIDRKPFATGYLDISRIKE
jgi:SAM-dependent methyltransferase